MADQHAAVTQELLVRYLDAWTPVALHGARRITYAATGMDGASIAALRVFGEFADRLAGRRLVMVVATPNPEAARTLGARLDAVHTELGAPPELIPHAVAAELVPALTEEGAFGAPIFAYLDGTAIPPEDSDLAALGGNRGTELLLAVDPATAGAPASTLVDRYRGILGASGLASLVHVELVAADGRARLLVFATANAKHLEKFKDELWAVDEFAGVRYRDPRDDRQTLLDISLAPDLGPLRRAVVAFVATGGEQTVGELRRFALTETVYRIADVTRLLPPLLASGALARDPERGRLVADTVIRAR